jgi:hypothetical protein
MFKPVKTKAFLITLLLFLPLSGQKGRIQNLLEKDGLATVKNKFMILEKNGTNSRGILLNRVAISDGDRDAALSAAVKTAGKVLTASADKKNMSNQSVFTDEDFEVVRENISPAGYHFRLRRKIDGIPVYGSDLTLSVIGGEVQSAAGAVDLKIPDFIPVFDLSGDRALDIADEYLRVKIPARYKEATEVIFPSAEYGMRSAWEVALVTDDPMGDWHIFIDARNGEILHAENRLLSLHNSANGHGMVWDPDPLTTAHAVYGGEYTDNNDADSPALNNERISVALHDLTLSDSGYVLRGPYVTLEDIGGPKDVFPVFENPDNFNFTRSQYGFEDVMVYYHVDKAYRRILSLGFSSTRLTEIKADPHGLDIDTTDNLTDDNSFYTSTTNDIRFGNGGVDDAEDADVIWHEYGHAIQYSLTGNMSYSGETFSVMEGSSDYWAASHSRGVDEYQWYNIFNWDGHNEFWDGRIANLNENNGHYPEDYRSGYAGAPLWSSALMEIWGKLGQEVTDKLFLQTHLLWGYSPGMRDAALAFMLANRQLYGNNHLSEIYDVFYRRGFIDPERMGPEITHFPKKMVSAVEDGEFLLTAKITEKFFPLDSSSIRLIYSYDDVDYSYSDTLSMLYNTLSDSFYATIPSVNYTADLYYFFQAADTEGYVSGSVNDTYLMKVINDTLAPVIHHTPDSLLCISSLPWTISAEISDETGIDTAWAEYEFYNGEELVEGTAGMLPADPETDTFIAVFSPDTSLLAEGDTLFYRIIAIDSSPGFHQSVIPEAGYFKAKVVAGKILLVSDNPVILKKSLGSAEGDPMSGDLIYSRLKAAGFYVDVEAPENSSNFDFNNYTLIIHSSGGNLFPLSDEAYRNKLKSWLAESDSNRLIIEGGDIAKRLQDDDFMHNVLHIGQWMEDSVGSWFPSPAYLEHPLLDGVHTISGEISVNYETPGDQDAVLALSTAYSVLLDEGGEFPGAVIYNPCGDSLGAQTIYFPFNGAALENSSEFQDLLENSVAFLLGYYPDKSAVLPEKETLPTQFSLKQNYPNPFNPSTVIAYEVSRPGRVRLMVFDILGRRIRTLRDGVLAAGRYRAVWDGKSDAGLEAASGIYFCILRGEGFYLARKMILLR